MKKKFKIFEQKRNYTCGHACMKSAIFYLTKNKVSEKKIILIGQKAEKYMKSQEHSGLKTYDEGLDFTGIKAIARQYGLEGISKANANINTIKFFLKKKLPVFVCWSPDEKDIRKEKDETVTILGHYSFILEIKNNKILLADPATGKKCYYPYKKFEKKWYKKYYTTPGIFKKKIPQWIAVFWKKGKKPDLSNIKGKRF